MSGYRTSNRSFVTTPPLAGSVRTLLLVTTGFLFVQVFLPELEPHLLLRWQGFRPWQLVTAMFCHADAFHFGFNMFMLWMFGSAVERSIGSRRLIILYLFAGIFGNLAWLLSGLCPPNVATLGASGAVFGLLFAYARLFPNQTILVLFIFPLKARNFAIFAGAIELIGAMRTTSDGVAHAVHLFGAIAAALYLEYELHGRIGLGLDLRGYWRRYRQRRHTRKNSNGAVIYDLDYFRRRKERAASDDPLDPPSGPNPVIN